MNEVAEKIAGEIGANGVISFARFMELALYCPVYGYYEKEPDTLGRAGDYYTSVSVGSLFGQLLALQFAEWLAAGPKCGGAQIVEAGAHEGRLAGDILGWLRQWRPGLFARLQYCIVEPSERRRNWQERRLGEFGRAVRWVRQLSELASADPSPVAGGGGGVRGIVFANELLDAMPVHRIGWDAKERTWFEWGVTLQEGRLAWAAVRSPQSTVQARGEQGSGLEWGYRVRGLDGYMGGAGGVERASNSWEELLAVLPDGFTLEVGLAAEGWWRQAANVLAQGRLLTIDYGLTAEQFLAPERREGTLRAYSRHRQSRAVLAHPGNQDITAHVNFSALRAAGESAGLETEAFLSQEDFLTRIAARIWQGEVGFGEWTPARTRQFRTLTHPQHLGRPFRVLVQRRGKLVMED
ncbi:MAG: SAM-dependent methyltransferase [Verrucomicrobiota bacterium]